jgi:(p)ppGpp synthase/HD superfamily hydrolase
LAQFPEFACGSVLLQSAHGFASGAHAEAGTEFAHPESVACLLAERGYDDEVVAAGYLHDVLEDTGMDPAEIGALFGPEVEELVATMTENPSIPSYEERKAEHRARVARHGARVAAIYAADKLAKTRLAHGDDPISNSQMSHYWSTLFELRDAYPDLPFLPELDEALAALDAERAQAARR